MSAMLDRLLAQLEARGLRVEAGDSPGTLRLVGATRAADALVLDALGAFKPALLERFGRAAAEAECAAPPPAPPPAPVVVATRVEVCAACRGPVDDKRRCWRCARRPCSGCGRDTGSVLIELCFACGNAEGRS